MAKQVVYFWLPSFEEELTGKSVSKLALYALIEAARVLKRSGQPLRCFVVVDEFQQVCGENVKIVLEMARSLGIHLILCHQDISQLRTTEYDNTSTIDAYFGDRVYGGNGYEVLWKEFVRLDDLRRLESL